MAGRIDIRSARARTGAWLCGALLALALGAQSPDPAAAGTCKNADAAIDEASAGELAAALRCLINDDREEQDLDRLHSDGKLTRAAAKHNKTMFEENCWAHDCPGEPNLERRIRDTGYLDGAKRWKYGENFGCAETAQAVLSEWLDKSFSRRNLRKRAFEDVGVAAAREQVPRSQCDEGTEITFTAVFARRNP